MLPYLNRMIRLGNDWGVRSRQQNYSIFKNRKNEDFSCNDDDVDLITDNTIELPSAPFPDITAEMPEYNWNADSVQAWWKNRITRPKSKN